jgi:hypothetical protein
VVQTTRTLLSTSSNSLNVLKAHPFFKGIDWANLRSNPSPIKKAVNPLKGEDKDTDYYKENVRKRTSLLSGLVRKYKKLLFYDTRQLILYDNGTLEYFDPEDGVMKVERTNQGTIVLGSKCSAVKKGPLDFDLNVPGRTYTLKAIEYTADKWVDTLNQEISRLSAPAKAPGMTLGDC